jgi:hypothetical protein
VGPSTKLLDAVMSKKTVNGESIERRISLGFIEAQEGCCPDFRECAENGRLFGRVAKEGRGDACRLGASIEGGRVAVDRPAARGATERRRRR